MGNNEIEELAIALYESEARASARVEDFPGWTKLSKLRRREYRRTVYQMLSEYTETFE